MVKGWYPDWVPVLLNISITDLEEATEHMLAKFAYDTKLGGAADMLEGRTASSVGCKENCFFYEDRLPIEAPWRLSRLNQIKAEQPGLTLWLTLFGAEGCHRDFLKSFSTRAILRSHTEGLFYWRIHTTQIKSLLQNSSLFSIIR